MWTPERDPIAQFEVRLFSVYGPTVPAEYSKQVQAPNGEFELEWDKAGPVDVVVKAKGFMDGLLPQVSLAPSQEQAERQEIILIPGGQLDGVVLNEAGQPVPGAHVELGRYMYSVSTPELPEELRNSPEAQAAIQDYIKQSNPNPWQETDRDGHFHLVDVPKGAYPLYASHPDYFPTSTEVTIQPGQLVPGLRLVLSKQGGVLVVHVNSAEGTPLADRRVAVEGGERTDRGTTDRQGEWRVDKLPPGTYRVSLHGDGASVAQRWAEVQVTAGHAAEVTFRLLPGVAVMGEVDRGGQPVGGVSLQAHQMNPASVGQNEIPAYATAATQTDSQGRFELPDLPAGDYQLLVNQGGTSATLTFSLAPSDRRRLFQIHLGTARLDGSIRDGNTGHPIGEATVKLFLTEPVAGQRASGDSLYASAEQEVSTNAQGFYALERLVAGRYVMDVQAASYGRVRRSIEVAQATSRYDVELVPGGQLIITVTDVDRLPLSGVSVFLAPRTDPEDTLVTSTDLHGIAQFTALAPGPYEVLVRSKTSQSTFQTTVDVVSGEVKKLEVIPSLAQ